MTDAADNIVPFGKYKGQPIEAMLADRAYTGWALAQPGIRERYPTFVTIVVNGGSAPDAPTPEHNKLQLSFRDPAMRVAVCRAIIGDETIMKQATEHWWWEATTRDSEVGKRLQEAVAILNAGSMAREAVWAQATETAAAAARMSPRPPQPEWPGSAAGKDAEEHYHSRMKSVREWDERASAFKTKSRNEADEAFREAASRKLREMVKSGEVRRWANKEIAEGRVEFEAQGWDVCIDRPFWLSSESLAVELKPTMGDDYPEVLRTLKMRQADYRRRVLIVDHFEAEGASLDDVKWVFSQSKIEVRTLAEIRAAMPAKS